MREVDLSLDSQFPAWVLLICAVVLIGTAMLFYWRVRDVLRKRAFAFLVGLRLLAVLVLLLLFLDPVLSTQQKGDRAEVAVLIDTSQSMRLTDGQRRKRLERVVEELMPPEGLLGTLDDAFDVHVYRFDSDAVVLDDTDGIETLAPEGKATNLAKSVRTVAGLHRASDLAGILVFTDGIHNAAPDPVDALRSVRMPLYLVGVGIERTGKSPYREGEKDVFITDVRTRPERFLTVNNKALVDVTLGSTGYLSPVERTLTLTERGGRKAGGTTVVVDGKKDRQRAVIEMVPTRVGKFIYEVEVSGDREETDPENNRYPITVHVIDPKIRVLYVDKPRPEYKQLQRTLSLDPNVTLLTLVNNRPGSFTQGGNIRDVTFVGFPERPDQLSTFDVIILGSVKRVYFSDRQLSVIRDFVREGKGLVMLGGTESFGLGGYGGTALDEVLPVVCGGPETGQERNAFLPRLTAEGKVHPIFAGAARFFQEGGVKNVAALELQGFNRVARVIPGASVLAVSPENGNAPVLVVRNAGKGKSAAFTAAGSHRWYRLTKPMGEDSPYVRFWGQLVRWLSGREAKERAIEPGITATVDRDTYEPGKEVAMVAHVRDRDGLETAEADVVVVLTGSSGEVVRRQLTYDDDARTYTAEVEPPAPGEYEAKFTAKLKGDLLGEARATFIVGRPSLELERHDPDFRLLRALVRGDADHPQPRRAFFELSTCGDVIDRLEPFRKHRSRPKQYKLTPALSGVLFALFVALMSAEWILRKRWQLL